MRIVKGALRLEIMYGDRETILKKEHQQYIKRQKSEHVCLYKRHVIFN